MAVLQWRRNLSVAPESFCRKVKLLQCYGLSETGFLTGLEDRSMSRASSYLVGGPVQELTCESRRDGKGVEVGQARELVARGAKRHAGLLEHPQDTALAFPKRNVSHGRLGFGIQTAISTSLTA